jgi:murein L,D-transpeptidase YafK
MASAGICCGALLLMIAIDGCSLSRHGNLPVADHIVISKSKHTLTLERSGRPLRTYTVALGRGGLLPKQHQGDHLTPEGEYRIDGKNANSRFHKALHLSYPTPEDTHRAETLHLAPGGDIEIHGLPKGLGWVGSRQHWMDWTDGCIALTNAEIDEVWRAVPIGTTVTIQH